MTIDKQSPEWLLGKQGEFCVTEYLRKQGYYVLETADLDKFGAPIIKNFQSQIILPDKLILKNGESRWCEVKTKTHPTPWDGKLQHGISANHYKHYLKLQTESKIEGWLYIVELEGKCLLSQAFNNLVVHHDNLMCNEKEKEGGIKPYLHVFFNRDLFIEEKLSLLPNIKIIPRAESTLNRLDKPLEEKKETASNPYFPSGKHKELFGIEFTLEFFNKLKELNQPDNVACFMSKKFLKKEFKDLEDNEKYHLTVCHDLKGNEN